MGVSKGNDIFRSIESTKISKYGPWDTKGIHQSLVSARVDGKAWPENIDGKVDWNKVFGMPERRGQRPTEGESKFCNNYFLYKFAEQNLIKVKRAFPVWPVIDTFLDCVYHSCFSRCLTSGVLGTHWLKN